MWRCKFLKYVGVACDIVLFVFVRAECHADKKKSISYKVDVFVDIDGCFVQYHCECAAVMGQPAVCNHVHCVYVHLLCCLAKKCLVGVER